MPWLRGAGRRRLPDSERGVELTEMQTPSQRDFGLRGTRIVTVQGSNGSILSNLPRCDFVSFLAVVQSLQVPVFEFEPDTTEGVPIGNRTHVIHIEKNQGIVFKDERDIKDEKLANTVLLSEILVLRHPVLSQHPNIQHLLGVAWRPRFDKTDFLRVDPYLVFRKSDYGSLVEFMEGHPKESEALSFLDRLRLCKDIGDGIAAMHSFNIVHTDIKPHNVLLFKEGGRHLAKVNDFGCTCFGAKESDVMELRGATPDWMAPEQEPVVQRGYQRCQIGTAKKMDAYSFGKVCAWLLFSQELRDDDVPDIPDVAQISVLAGAMDSLKVTVEHSGELSNAKFVAEVTHLLHGFFAASYTSEPESRESLRRLTARLGAMLRSWELKYNESRPRFARVRVVGKDAIAAWHGVGARVTALLAKFFSLFIPKKAKAEFFVPGELRMVFLSGKNKQLFLLMLCMFLVCIFLGIVGLYLWALLGTRDNKGKLTILVILVVVVVACGWLFCLIVWTGWYGRAEYRARSRIFAPFGHVAHLVPKLPRLFPVLNRQQYVVRDEVVKGLTRKVTGDCEICRVKAAEQLALCCRAAFSRSNQSFHTSCGWLAESGKAHVNDLCKETDFWEDRFRATAGKLDRTMRESPDLFTLDLEESEFYLETLPTTIMRYKEEIKGKVDGGVCISSAAVLQMALGKLCFEHYMYKDAEAALQGGLKTKDDVQLLPRWKRGFFSVPKEDCDDKDLLARALKKQGKFMEAADVIRSIPSVTGPMERRPRFWKKKVSIDHDEWSDRLRRQTLVLKCLIATGRVDEGWESRVIESLREARVDWWRDCEDCRDRVERTLFVLGRLADALAVQNRVQEAIDVSSQSEMLHEKYFAEVPAKESDRKSGDRGDGERRIRDPRIWTAARKHASILTLGTPRQINEALGIQEVLRHDGTFSETDEEALALLTEHTMGLSRAGKLGEALELADRILEIKKAVFGDVHIVSLGSMADLAGSLCLHNREALEAPALMQREMLSIARDFSNKPSIQQQIISLLWSLSRPESLDESISKLRALSEYCGTQYPNQGEVIFKLRYWLAFILLHFGATYEDQALLEDSEKLIDNLEARVRESSGDWTAKLLDVARLHAAVQFKETKLLCGYGFGMEEFHRFDRAIQVHRSAFEAATDMFEPNHRLVEGCRIRLAIMLSEVGVALHRDKLIAEARLIFQGMKKLPQAKYWGYALALMNDEEVDEVKVHSAFKKFRHWVVGDTMAVHPGDLALDVDLAELLWNQGGHHTRARKTLYESRKNFHARRKGWTLNPDHHPDVLRATYAYARLQYRRGSYHKEVAQARQLNWWATLTHRAATQERPLLRYRMNLALALSPYKEHLLESITIGREVLEKTRTAHGTPHVSTATAWYSGDLALLLRENGDRDDAIRRYSEALETYHTMFGPDHPSTHNAGRRLLGVLKQGTDKNKVREEVRQVLHDIDDRRVVETTWSRKKLSNTGIMFCSSLQYLGPTHYLTRSSRKTLEFMFEAGGFSPTNIESLLARLGSIRYVEKMQYW